MLHQQLMAIARTIPKLVNPVHAASVGNRKPFGNVFGHGKLIGLLRPGCRSHPLNNNIQVRSDGGGYTRCQTIDQFSLVCSFLGGATQRDQ